MESAALASRDAWNEKLIELALAAESEDPSSNGAVAGEAWSQHFEDLFHFLSDSREPPIGDFAEDFI